MKKIIALTLAATMLLTLCSCGGGDGEGEDKKGGSANVATVPYTVEFEDVKDGYIKHANKGMYEIVEASGYQSTDDFYIFLPVNSVISSEKEFNLFCYDSEFVMDSATMKSSGQEMDKLNPVWAAGERVLTLDSYVRISVKGTLSDITIKVPEKTAGLAGYGSKEALINMPIIQTTTTYFENREQAVNYIFITDIHYGSNPESAESQVLISQVKLAVEMANTIDAIDFIAIGGDITTGMYETKADAIKCTQEALAPLKDCKKPVFVMMGNHDDNSYHRFTYDVYYPERIISDKDWNDNVLKEYCPENIVHDKDYKYSKYYYYDLPEKKTRVICLDAVDYRAEFNSKGVISELPIKDATKTEHVARYWSGCSWWGYSEDQIKWLANVAMTADSDWDYVFFSHMGIDANTNCYNYQTKGGSELKNLIKAFQNRSVFKLNEVNKNYGNVSGKILTYQFGHNHAELTNRNSELKLWEVGTATARPSTSTGTLANSSITNKTLDWHLLERGGAEENKFCFDIMSADKNSILKFGYGASNDAQMPY